MSTLKILTNLYSEKNTCKPQKDKQDMWDTGGEAKTNSQVTFFYGLLHTDMPVLANQE